MRTEQIEQKEWEHKNCFRFCFISGHFPHQFLHPNLSFVRKFDRKMYFNAIYYSRDVLFAWELWLHKNGIDAHFGI